MNFNQNKRILLFIKTPPPLTGATLMNNYVKNSFVLNSKFDIDVIELHYKKHNKGTNYLSYIKIFLILNYLYKLITQLFSNNYNFVYFQITIKGIGFYRDILFVLIIKAFRIKIVYHLHGIGIEQISKNSHLQKYLYKFIFKNSFVITLSQLLCNDIIDVYSGVPYIVNNGIASINITSKQSEDNEKPKILFLSYIDTSKGIVELLDSLKIVMDRNFEFQCSIVGIEKNISEMKLKSLIKKRNLTEVVSYLGSKYNNEKHKIFQCSDIFVYPTKNDSWGLVLLEAMQASLPVISTNEGAISEIVDDGVTGFVVDKENPNQLAKKIEILLTNKELRTKMGKAGRKKYVQKYTLEIFEKNMKNVFDSVLEEITKK